MNAMRQDAARSARGGEELLFLRRWLANPGKVGAVLPSSAALGRLYGTPVEVIRIPAGRAQGQHLCVPVHRD